MWELFPQRAYIQSERTQLAEAAVGVALQNNKPKGLLSQGYCVFKYLVDIIFGILEGVFLGQISNLHGLEWPSISIGKKLREKMSVQFY